MKNRKDRDAVDLDRDYNQEAASLIEGLGRGDLHQLYEIVIQKLKRQNSPNRTAELRAVKKAIEAQPGLDRPRMKKMITGYRSKMAATANPKHGNTRKSSKKA